MFLSVFTREVHFISTILKMAEAIEEQRVLETRTDRVRLRPKQSRRVLI